MNVTKLIRLVVLPAIGIASIGQAQTLEAASTAAAKLAASSVTADFPSSSPEAVGVDSQPLIRMSEWIRNDKLDVRSLLVIKDGKLIFERYSGGLVRDNNYELYSVTKSVTSLLVGILNGEGKLGPNDKVVPGIVAAHPELKDALADKQDLKVRDLLSMSSGLFYKQTEGSDTLYYGVPNRLSVAAKSQAKLPPGKEFDYTDVNPVLVGAMVSAAARQREQKFAEEKLFKPLGMSHYRWDGIDQTGFVSGGWGLRLRPIDMAKLGTLLLNDGQWQGKQVVPAAWIKQMTTPANPVLAKDYGYYCWINHIVEGQPEFGAMGFKGQFITVLPKENAIVVMTSLLPTDGGLRDATYLQMYRRMVNDYILPALQAGKKVAPSAARQAALTKELRLSQQSKGVAGTATAFNDPPEF
ncbi:serine hydrolase domain-containing protein [Undibacterium arcticum]|uniref:Serine hydrolase domain-containing protein n=1 Tax=Undibacterium arcticum TaxID=1762892 RepID=A0ABV7F567_9BURK